jgi:hypothetical protein
MEVKPTPWHVLASNWLSTQGKLGQNRATSFLWPSASMSLNGAHFSARFGARVMYWEQFGRVIVQVKRALRNDRRLTAEQFNQLLQLSEAIIDYGRMIQAHRRHSVPNVILEITELANRFRETPQTIKDALLLLRDIGCAQPADLDGCWKLQLGRCSARRPQGFSLGDAPLP